MVETRIHNNLFGTNHNLIIKSFALGINLKKKFQLVNKLELLEHIGV